MIGLLRKVRSVFNQKLKTFVLYILVLCGGIVFQPQFLDCSDLTVLEGRKFTFVVEYIYFCFDISILVFRAKIFINVCQVFCLY